MRERDEDRDRKRERRKRERRRGGAWPAWWPVSGGAARGGGVAKGPGGAEPRWAWMEEKEEKMMVIISGDVSG